MSTVDSYSAIRLFRFDDDMNIVCSLCDTLLILILGAVRTRFTWAELDGAILGHLVSHHPHLVAEMSLALSQAVKQRDNDPEQQPQGNEVDAARHANGGKEEAQGGRDQRDQGNERHVDPFSLRGRLQT